MSERKIKMLVMAALLAALTCVATLVIQVPSPMSGYVNLGDCMVLFSAWLLGPWWGAAAAGIGSMMADVLTPYLYYAPGTLIIKSLMAVVAGVVSRRFERGGRGMVWLGRAVAAAASEALMVGGYFLYAALLLKNGWGAAASIPGNCVQGAFGIVIGILLDRLLTDRLTSALKK